MRAIVNAYLSYGLVNVPVSVCTSAKRKETSFKTLHVDCGTPLKMRYQCPTCAAPVEAPEIVKGFEVAKGTFLHVPQEEIDRLGSERPKNIAIRKFVAAADMQELAIEKSYYLAPNPKLPFAYVLLVRAMLKYDVVGFGKHSLWGREDPVMVWPTNSGSLVLSPLFCFDEVVAEDEIVSVVEASEKLVPEDAQNLANEYVALNVKKFYPQEDLVSDSRKRMDEYLSSLASGIDFSMLDPDPTPEPTLDLMETLRESVASSR